MKKQIKKSSIPDLITCFDVQKDRIYRLDQKKQFSEFCSGDLGTPWELSKENIFQKLIKFFKSWKKRFIRKTLYVQMCGRAIRKPKSKIVFVSTPGRFKMMDTPWHMLFYDEIDVDPPQHNLPIFQHITDQIEEGYISHPVICKVY